MNCTEWSAILAGVAGILTPIGLAFGWLIRTIVSQSKEAVTELRKTNERAMAKMEKERDTWRERALKAGWKGE